MELGKAPAVSPGELRSSIEASAPATPVKLSTGDVIIHIPVAARGEPFGTVILWGISEQYVVDEQILRTIGSEFGVAYENQQRYLEVKDLADRDPVTGLFNHRYFHKEVNACLEEHRAASKPFGVVIMDIDDFKLFNDTYGHPKGDAVLKLLAKQLLEAGKKQNIVAARFGGDEFAVLLPECDRKATVEFMRQFKEWIRTQSYQESGGELIPIRVSLGYAIYPDDGARAYEIVAVADSALYDSKRAGAFAPLGDRTVIDIIDNKGGSFKMLQGLITAVDNKDQYTKAHCDLVAEFAVTIAAGLGLSAEVQRSLAVAGALHDVGKICIPDRVLRKPGPLTDEEYETVKMHVPMASSLIQNVPRRRDILDAVMNHHEQYDGSGYPRGLRGTEIPFVGRIISIADAFSAMTLDRPYRKAMPLELAIRELTTHAGQQFDPEIVEVFIKELQRQPQPVGARETGPNVHV
jgi:diguanylate cyclase (GGDEF)-like protein